MKREIRNAISQGIKESELNGYKWTITENGMKWSYGEEFTFHLDNVGDDEFFLTVRAVNYGATMAGVIVGSGRFCDCSNLVDAYRIATKATIHTANHIY